ncbi:hypothetical protein PR202_ga19216 [Eleusine coracana subsp. coracana]|uniref:SRR1-like domain-containing protein n=1 Tax=Eleusine coracana subsp. coracana TaxID=191504 RepID=A0AAV5CVD0_ELECO|nr:hypothetical protein PR202_ga19216 [Eleusine coracana subsp. coracana]
MPAAPGTGPGCLGSPVQAPSSSFAGVKGAPRQLGVSKPSWIVRTESNVRRERPKRPDPPCNVCKGTGRIDCRNCFGRGRTNHADLVMLPKGEWPLWCRICGGSGLDYCHRCHGTGNLLLVDVLSSGRLVGDQVQLESFKSYGFDKNGPNSALENLLNLNNSENPPKPPHQGEKTPTKGEGACAATHSAAAVVFDLGGMCVPDSATARASASSPPSPAPDPGAVAGRTMEADQETRALPGGAGSSRVVMEEFVMGDHARLLDSMRLAKELAASSILFAKLSDLFASDAAFREDLARVRGDSSEPLRVVAYGLGGTQYSWAPRFRLAVLLLLRDTFPEVVGAVEVVCPTVAPVERRALEELGCVVSALTAPCRPVHEPTLIFMPYPDRVFFENLLILNWSAEQLGKIILFGQSFNAMVKMLELSMSKQEKFGVTVQREGNCTTRIWTAVNIQMNYDAQLLGSSSLYTEFTDHLKENPSIRDRISSMLGDHECMELVIYGLGSFEFDVKSQYQLAFALLLKEDNIFPVGDIEIYDPALSPADVMACFKLGIKVLLVNEQCRRSVEKPTLFFVPGLKFTGNLIEANFSPKQLNKMILVSYGLKDSGKGTPDALENMDCGLTCSIGSLALERNRFLWACMDYIHEAIAMDNFQEGLFAVSGLEFEFFEVADDMDMNVKLPSLALKEKFYFDFGLEMEWNSSLAFEEDECECKDDDPPFWGQVFCHRLPEMNRTTWSPPPNGWIKLNFHGIGCSKGLPASIGGIFHNDKGEVLSYYAGPIGDVDQIVASSKALEVGLQRMIEHYEPVYKLIIEGDNLSVIRWCNRITHPPERAKDSFMHSFWLMDLRPCKETEAPATAKATEECNEKKCKDEDVGSKDKHEDECNEKEGKVEDVGSKDKHEDECNEKEGKDEDVGSKDKHEDDDSKDEGEDDGASQGETSGFVIPPGWASREYIAWRVEEAANQVAVDLASLGRYLPGFIEHLSTVCDCGHGMDMKKDKPDITWACMETGVLDRGLLDRIATRCESSASEAAAANRGQRAGLCPPRLAMAAELQ